VARAQTTGWVGAAYWDHEDPAEAIPLLEHTIEQLQHLSGTGGYRRFDGWFLAVLSEAYLMTGDLDRARDVASRALTATEGFPLAAGYAERAIGRLALASQDIDTAEASLRRAVETFASIDARCEVEHSRVTMAEILARGGKHEAARAELTAAHEAFRRMRAPRLVERAERVARKFGLTLGEP
jgi:tetratricopeptide (TPR) repeat protein